jgi:rhodanese-related sulfurtransferase
MREVLTPVLLGLFIVIIAIAGGGCNSTAGVTQTTTTPTKMTNGIYDVSVAEAYNIIQANKDNANFHIIDIRTADEYASGHLANADQLDYYSSNFKTDLDKLDRTETYLIYCRTGHRSGLARDIMKEMGFLSLYNMTDGITAWQEAGYGVVK